MDWNFLKKILRIFLGALLLLGGIGLMIFSFVKGFEITLTFLAFLILCGGVCAVMFGILSLRSSD